MTRIQDIAAFAEVREAGLAKLVPQRPRIGVGMGTCGSGNGAEAVFQAFASAIDARGLDDAYRRGDDFRSDSVARNQCDRMFCHLMNPK